MLSKSDIRDALAYDPETGVFTWLIKPSLGVSAGDRAGAMTSQGYVTICFKRQAYKAHRLAWFFQHGAWPRMIDHKNGDRTDNRISNLRIATASQNMWNKALNPKCRSGMKGVSERVGNGRSFGPNCKRFIATISAHGKRHHLGLFSTAEDAHAAYVRAAHELHGEFARP